MRFMPPLLAILAFAQIGSGQVFEVASIRLNKLDSSGIDSRRISIDASPGALIMRNVTLMSCIRWAYSVQDYQIVGGPDWRSSERYDIAAKPPAAASESQLRVMLRALLADRFKLALRHQSKELPVYVLTVSKNGHRLKPSRGPRERGLRPADRGLSFENVSMPDLEQFLSNLPVFDRPVLDRTGLEGQFDFTLTLFDKEIEGDVSAVKGAVAGTSPAVYADALERIGLRLESERMPIDIVLIDHVEKPSEN
jgi:uncharacterized protein (TIGR03435 family)